MKRSAKPPRAYRKRVQKKKGNMMRKARMNNNDIHKVVIAGSGGLTPGQGLTVSNYVYTYWSPIPNLNLQNSNQLFNQPEFALYRALYDQFRVNGVSVRLIPRIKTAEAGAMITAEGVSNAVTFGKGIVYTVEDRDGLAPSNIPALKRYASVKTHSIFKTINRSYSVKYKNADMWFDCQDPAGAVDTTKLLGLNGGITIYGESFPEPKNTLINDPWYDIEIKYAVTFKGKAATNLSVQQDGSVVVQPAELVGDELPVQAEEQLNHGGHSGAIDTNGDRIN